MSPAEFDALGKKRPSLPGNAQAAKDAYLCKFYQALDTNEAQLNSVIVQERDQGLEILIATIIGKEMMLKMRQSGNAGEEGIDPTVYMQLVSFASVEKAVDDFAQNLIDGVVDVHDYEAERRIAFAELISSDAALTTLHACNIMRELEENTLSYVNLRQGMLDAEVESERQTLEAYCGEAIAKINEPALKLDDIDSTVDSNFPGLDMLNEINAKTVALRAAALKVFNDRMKAAKDAKEATFDAGFKVTFESPNYPSRVYDCTGDAATSEIEALIEAFKDATLHGSARGQHMIDSNGDGIADVDE